MTQTLLQQAAPLTAFFQGEFSSNKEEKKRQQQENTLMFLIRHFCLFFISGELLPVNQTITQIHTCTEFIEVNQQ